MRKLGDTLLKIFTFLVYVVLYLPIIVMIVFSFNDARLLAGIWTGFTTKWYAELFGDQEIWIAFSNSVQIAVIATVVQVLVAIPVALVMARRFFRGKPVLSSYLYVPLIVPELAESLTIFLFYTWIIRLFGINLRGFWGIILGQIVWFPLVYVVLRARFAGLNPQLEEAARMLGANEFQTFLRVTFPLIMPGVIAGGLMAFTWSFDDFYKVSFSTAPGLETLPLKIWSFAAKGGVTPEVNALATISLVISVSLAVVYMRFSTK